VDFHQGDGGIVYRRAEVCDPRAVCRSHFAHDCAAGVHDVGEAEAATDFDEFSPGDDDFAIAGEGGEGEDEGGGVVVDDGGGFGAGEGAEEIADEMGAATAFAGFEIEFDGGVASGDFGQGGDGGFCEGRSSEAGVDDDAGGVDDGREDGAVYFVKKGGDGGEEVVGGIIEERAVCAIGQVHANLLKCRPRAFNHKGPGRSGIGVPVAP